MKKIFLARYGAYGDHIHMSNVLRAFKQEGYEITFEYNWKGLQLHVSNPYIDHHRFYEPYANNSDPKDKRNRVNLYWRLQSYSNIYDKVINLSGSIEDSLIPSETTPHYFYPKTWKSNRYAKICYYDQSILKCGLPSKYFGMTGDVFFKRDEHKHVIEKLKPYKDKFIVIWCLAGSMWQKAIYPWSKNVIDEFHMMYPNTFFILTADASHKHRAWENDYTMSVCGVWPFRQVLLTTRYANMVITPETGLGIGAGSYSTPKIMLLTAASLKNVVGNDKNDFSLQSEAWCSPCNRAIYNIQSCYVDDKDNLPICVYFDKERLLEQMIKIYDLDYKPNFTLKDDSVYK